MTEDKIEGKLIIKNCGIGLVISVAIMLIGMVVKIDQGFMLLISSVVFLAYFTTMTMIIHTTRQLTEMEGRIMTAMGKEEAEEAETTDGSNN